MVCDVASAGVRFSGLTVDDRMSSGELGPLSRRRGGGSADEASEMEAELARIHREMQRRFGDQVGVSTTLGSGWAQAQPSDVVWA